MTSRQVTLTHNNLDTELTNVTVASADGGTDTIETTPHHPFWAANVGRWIDAGNLTVGTVLLASDGSRVIVTAVRTFGMAKWMRDLTVATVHTYYVIAGNTPVLVHNCNEVFYRAMSEKEFAQLGSNGEITVKQTENFVTQSRPYLEGLRSRYARRGGRNAEKYTVLVRCEMAPGTRDALIAGGKRSRDIGQDTRAVHLKMERGAETFGLRPGSVGIFNSRIIGFQRMDW